MEVLGTFDVDVLDRHLIECLQMEVIQSTETLVVVLYDLELECCWSAAVIGLVWGFVHVFDKHLFSDDDFMLLVFVKSHLQMKAVPVPKK